MDIPAVSMPIGRLTRWYSSVVRRYFGGVSARCVALISTSTESTSRSTPVVPRRFLSVNLMPSWSIRS